MASIHFRRNERRRTTRVSIFADLIVQGLTENNEKFKLQTRSLSVSGFGGLTVLDAAVVPGQILLITNDNSRQKAECKVISVRPGGDGKNIVAFEFLTPNVNFWKMSFPAAGAKPIRRVLPSTATAQENKTGLLI
jgi:c-di-GMP-binding flagellar brake protein YcgR